QYFAASAGSLEELALHNNQISNDIKTLEAFKGAGKLKKLSLSNNQITGAGLQYFAASAGSLEGLYLHKNQIKQETLTEVLAFNKLKELTIDTNVAPQNHLIYEQLRSRGTNIQFIYRDDIPTQPNLN